MAKFMVEVPHSKEECLKMLDEMMENKPKQLDKFYWGCSTGNHTGWAFMDADTENEVRNMLPSTMRDEVRITKVDLFTPKQIKAFHEKKYA